MSLNLASFLADVALMADACFDAIEVPFEETTELERQVVATFVFGMQQAAGMIACASPAELYSATTAFLEASFRYSRAQAVAFADSLVEAASGTGNPLSNAIVHRGIDGHLQWIRRDKVALCQNLTDVLVRVHEASSEE